MLEWLIERIVALIIVVLILYGLYIVLSNGAYYGGKLGDLVRGLIDGVVSFARHATS